MPQGQELAAAGLMALHNCTSVLFVLAALAAFVMAVAWDREEGMPSGANSASGRTIRAHASDARTPGSAIEEK
jgi:hypothetical protein